MRQISCFLLILLLSAAALPSPVYTKELKTQTLRINKIYKSMEGPAALQSFQLEKTEKRELLWIVGYEAIVVEPKSGKKISQEYLCHSNLDYEPETYRDTIGNFPLDGRFFTLSQGQQRVEFPTGFGLPIYSDEEIKLGTQVLNLNDPKLDKKVRYQVRVDYVKDSETETPMRALRQVGVYGMKIVLKEDEFCAPPNKDHGTTCAVGQAAMPEAAMIDLGQGADLTAHWVVEPGREVNPTDITPLLALQEELSVHYIAVHLHPFAESLELKDDTAGKVLFKAKVTPAEQRVGIKHIDHLSSSEGIKFLPGHKYTLTSVYNNTTDKNVDSMAVMYLYGAVPAPPALSGKSEPSENEGR